MSKYLPYQGVAWEMRKLAKANGVKLKDVVSGLEEEVYANISYGEDFQSKERSEINVTLDIIEMAHYGLSHRVIYVDNESCQGFISQKNDVVAKEISPAYPIFEICPEVGTKIPGTQEDLPSFLVAWPGDITTRAVASMLKLAVEHKAKPPFTDAPIYKKFIQAVDDVAIGVVPGENKKFFKIFKHVIYVIYNFRGKWLYIKAPMVWDKGIEAMVHALKPECPEDDTLLTEGWGSVDDACQVAVMRLLFNVLTYMNIEGIAVPDYKPHDRPHMGTIAPKSSIIQGMGYHLRCSFARTLRHQKYYHDKPYPPEQWRIIHVRGTLVRQKAAPAEPERTIIKEIKKEE